MKVDQSSRSKKKFPSSSRLLCRCARIRLNRREITRELLSIPSEYWIIECKKASFSPIHFASNLANIRNKTPQITDLLQNRSFAYKPIKSTQQEILRDFIRHSQYSQLVSSWLSNCSPKISDQIAFTQHPIARNLYGNEKSVFALWPPANNDTCDAFTNGGVLCVRILR